MGYCTRINSKASAYAILASETEKTYYGASLDIRGLKSAISGITDIFHKVENLWKKKYPLRICRRSWMQTRN